MSILHILVGGAGFIGANLSKTLLLRSDSTVCILDNLSRGKIKFLENHDKGNRVSFIECDASESKACIDAFASLKLSTYSDVVVWHLAANSDIPAGISDITVDFRDTFKTTVSILVAMKKIGLSNLCFASSSAIYGDHGFRELKEDTGNCLPISNYGAMKLASEAVISAACECDLKSALIFRFPNVVGSPATHGVIYDFINRLFESPGELHVLGDGTQQKAYLHVNDLVSAMMFMYSRVDRTGLEIVNIGPADQGVKVSEISEIVANFFEPTPSIVFGTAQKGWVGDVPKFRYNIDKLSNFGWKPTMNSREAVKLAATQIFNEIKNIKNDKG